jgi:hypothetical protein
MLVILANNDLVAWNPIRPDDEEANGRDGHADHDVVDPETEVWPLHHA